ncbi:NADH-ubiquinone oxidoreductase-F iron-sulfur binding region domain-containing protein [Azospirillum sp.]|uniref:NADH-ubiquinone oxidoreductase-F iron-sulfur binding region domain-containing protein n=1 Tax=Azospirillum sp. TaxID=34012 RepID=UPI003D71EA1A
MSNNPDRRRRPAALPKGRPVDPAALEEVRALLGDAPRRRDGLLDALHRIQDRFGCLHVRHLTALAAEMRLAQTEVFEVASFYAHFDVVHEGEEPPPPVSVRVCDGIACTMAGVEDMVRDLAGRLGPGVRIVRAPCMGGCDRAPSATVNHTPVEPAGPDTVLAALNGTYRVRIPAPVRFAEYRAQGGYALLGACRDGRRTPEQVLAALEESALRGMGGAGFPTGRKWRLVRGEPAPRHLVVNADEGEPGTFKDRHYLETDPHRFLEGMLLAAWVIEAAEVHLYLRDEYPQARTILHGEIAALEDAGLVTPGFIRVHRGAGAYICGEESSMLESIEGKRPLPRHKPPFPAQVGLFGRPTLINNIETLFWARDIVEKGAAWWSAQGRNGRQGLRTYSVSGRVRLPGPKVAPAGITVRELIDEFCGGMAEGHRFKAYLPGGASGGLLPASLGDLPLDFGALEPHGCFIGSAAVIVLSDKDDLRQAALNLLRFFRNESCGQCTPCRVGTEKAVLFLEHDPGNRAGFEALTKVMMDASICGLGQAAMNPVRSILRHFPEELA